MVGWEAYETVGVGLYGHEEIELSCHCCSTTIRCPVIAIASEMYKQGWLYFEESKMAACPECLKRFPLPGGSANVDRTRCALDNLAAVAKKMSLKKVINEPNT